MTSPSALQFSLYDIIIEEKSIGLFK